MKHHFSFFILWAFTLPLIAQVSDLPDMNSARSGHALAQLTNGDLLTCGGHDGSSFVPSAEIYNGDTWSMVDPMGFTRYSFTLESTPYGALAIGGWDGGSANHATTEVFQSEFNVWDNGPTLNIGRSNHRSLVLNDGRILVVGGFDGSQDLTSCEIIDPSDWSVTVTGSLNEARSSHAVVLLNDGKVLAMGGYNPDLGYQMSTCELYDPNTGTWATTAAMASARDNHSAAVTSTGTVVVSGGRYYDAENDWFAGLNTSEVYDPASETWSSASDLTTGSSFSQSYYRSASDDVLLIAGTNLSGNGVEATFGNNQLNNFGPDSWYEDQSVNTIGRHRQASCMLTSGGIVVSGGQDDATVQLIGEYTSVAEGAQTSWGVYPNPSNTVCNIAGPKGVPFAVYALDGKLMETGVTGSTLDLRMWGAGAYTVVVGTRAAVLRLMVY